MYAPTFVVTSAYERQMRDGVASLSADGILAFRIEALATRMGRQVTAAFRRHLSQLCQDGTLTRFEYFTDAGGRAIAYAIGPEQPSGEPF